MSKRIKEIENLHHQLREAQRESAEKDRVVKLLVDECELNSVNPEIESQDERNFKGEILKAWMNEYEKEAKDLREIDGWSGVIGDIMDEMQQRIPETGTSRTDGNNRPEIDFRSMIQILDDDAKNLGELCGELLVKFFPDRIRLVKEKMRHRQDLQEKERGNCTETGDGESKIQTEAGESTIKDEIETKLTEESQVGKDEQNDGQTEVGAITATGDTELNPFEQAFAVTATGDTESKAVEEEFEVINPTKMGNYIQFTVVDENGQPLGIIDSSVKTDQTDGTGDKEDTPQQLEPKSVVRGSNVSFEESHETLESSRSGTPEPVEEPQIWVTIDSDVINQIVYETVSIFVDEGGANGNGQTHHI